MISPAGPLPVRSDNGPWPLHDVESTRALEREALKDLPAGALMDRAGFAVARLTLALAPHASAVEVWAGPGNNGGDGWAAARHLVLAGKQVRVTQLGQVASLPAEARQAREQALSAGVLSVAMGEVPGPAEICIDALLGIGSARSPQGEMLEAIRRINAAAGTVLAVDVPSGLHADTGSV